MKKIIFFALLISFELLTAQSLDFYSNLIHSDKDSVITKLTNSGYEIDKVIPNEGCSGYKLKKGKTTLLYNVCYNEEGDVVNLNLICRNLETPYSLLNQAFNDNTLTSKVSTVEANTSFIFENDYIELFFVFDHFHNIHYMEISNSNRYEMIKEIFESKSNFNSKTNGIYLIRKMLNEKNTKGESIEDILKDSDIKSDFNLLDYKEATDYVIKFRKTKKYSNLKKIIDKALFSDDLYIKKIKTTFRKFRKWMNNENNPSEMSEEALFKIFIENNKFKSIMMFDYIFKKLEKN